MAMEGCEIVHEDLCQQSTVGTARPAVTDLTQSLCVFVAIAAREEVQSTTHSVNKDRSRKGMSEACVSACVTHHSLLR